MPVERNATFYYFLVTGTYADVCLHFLVFNLPLYNKKKLHESSSKLNVFWIYC